MATIRNKVIFGAGLIIFIILFVLFARYVMFPDQIEKWEAGIERIGEWEKDYRSKNPGASDREVDAAFKAGMADLTVWKEQYKRNNPGATDADADAAFNAAWQK